MNNNIHIVLEKGEAKKPFTELTNEEFAQIGKKVFAEVTKLASTIGTQPVTTHTVRKNRGRRAT